MTFFTCIATVFCGFKSNNCGINKILDINTGQCVSVNDHEHGPSGATNQPLYLFGPINQSFDINNHKPSVHEQSSTSGNNSANEIPLDGYIERPTPKYHYNCVRTISCEYFEDEEEVREFLALGGSFKQGTFGLGSTRPTGPGIKIDPEPPRSDTLLLKQVGSTAGVKGFVPEPPRSNTLSGLFVQVGSTAGVKGFGKHNPYS